MRQTATKNGVSVRSYAGTTGILLGMNIDYVPLYLPRSFVYTNHRDSQLLSSRRSNLAST